MSATGRCVSWQTLALASVAACALFVLYPLLTLAANSLRSAGGLGLAGFAGLLGTRTCLQGLLDTIILSLAATAAATVVGVTFAFTVARFDFPFKRLAATLPVATIVIPQVIVCQSWLLILGNNGLLTRAVRGLGIAMPTFYGWGGLILVMTLVHYAYIYLGTLAALNGFDRHLEEASRSLGRTPFQTAFRVVLPAILPAILVNALVVFALVAGNFAISAILCGPIPLLSVLTFNAFVSELGGNPLMQSTLSLEMIALVAAAVFIQKRMVERRQVQMTQGRAPAAVPVSSWHGAFLAGFVALVLALSFLPLLTMFAAAFSASRGPVVHWGSFSLAGIERVLTRGWTPILNSLKFASLATLFGIPFAVLASYLIVKQRSLLTQALDHLVVLPLAISGTVLGIGLVQAFNGGALAIAGTSLIMVVAYVVRRLPFSVRSAASSLFLIPDTLEEASISLGVPPLRTFFKVVLPLMAASVASAAVLMWATTLSELDASIVLYGGGQETLPIAIYREIDSGRMGLASAYGTVLVALIALPVLVAVKAFRIRLFSTR
jgi:iron(III) transport system permease protein